MLKKNEIVPTKILETIKNGVNQGHYYFKRTHPIVFLFGGNINDSSTARYNFLEYARKHLHDYEFLLAEDFFNFFQSDVNDLLEIEKNLSDYTDCVLILLESSGSIAELGAFSYDTELAKKILVINDESHKDNQSFINLGPIQRINKYSIYGEVISTKFNAVLKSSFEINERLKIILKRSMNIKEATDIKNNKKYKLLFVSDMITLLSPITLSNLNQVFSYIFEDEEIDISFEVNLLQTLKFIATRGSYLFKREYNERLFFKHKHKEFLPLRAIVLNHYLKYQKELINSSGF